MKFRTETHDYFELPNGVEVELPITPEDWLQDSVEVVERPDGGFRVAYLVHDSDCSNPLEACDGLGKIWHHPRSRYAEKHTDYYGVCGLDRYGSPIIDEEALQKMWHDKVMALSLQDFYVNPELRELASAEDLREALADEPIIGGYRFSLNATSAWGCLLADADPDEFDELIDKVEEKLLDWDYSAAERECQQPMDKYAVFIDVYEHGQRSYSLSGTGMQCRWDTSSEEAVWVADPYAKDEIDRRAKVYAFGTVVERGYRSSTRYAAIVDPISTQFLVDQGGEIGEYEHWHEAFAALTQYVSNFGAPNEDQEQRGHHRALHEIAKDGIAVFDSWQRGECYGVVCVDYDAQGEQIGDEDACFGYIGQEYAEETRDKYLKEVAQVKEAA